MAMALQPPHALEERLGYEFQNPLLLAEALTHPSLAYETHRSHFDNQRLEFLGDAVLQLIFTSELFHRFIQFNEGNLTKLRARLVSRTALAIYARRLPLGKHLLMGRGEESSGGRERASTLSDAFEAIIGAIFLDGGLDCTRHVILQLCGDELRTVCDEPREINPKGQLQESLQTLAMGSPYYTIVSDEGPDHMKIFEASVEWNGKILATGKGPSKKIAETAAAEAALATEIVRQILEKGVNLTTVNNHSDNVGSNT